MLLFIIIIWDFYPASNEPTLNLLWAQKDPSWIYSKKSRTTHGLTLGQEMELPGTEGNLKHLRACVTSRAWGLGQYFLKAKSEKGRMQGSVFSSPSWFLFFPLPGTLHFCCSPCSEKKNILMLVLYSFHSFSWGLWILLYFLNLLSYNQQKLYAFKVYNVIFFFIKVYVMKWLPQSS